MKASKNTFGVNQFWRWLTQFLLCRFYWTQDSFFLAIDTEDLDVISFRSFRFEGADVVEYVFFNLRRSPKFQLYVPWICYFTLIRFLKGKGKKKKRWICQWPSPLFLLPSLTSISHFALSICLSFSCPFLCFPWLNILVFPQQPYITHNFSFMKLIFLNGSQCAKWHVFTQHI